MKTVYILLGPKGSGKSHIGRLMESRLGIPFLLTEDIFLQFQKQGLETQDVYKAGFVETAKTIERLLKTKYALAFESTGASPLFFELLESLRLQFDIKLIAVSASAKVCLTRIRSRDAGVHMPADDALIEKVHRISSGPALDYDLIIRNENLRESEIVELLQSVTATEQERGAISYYGGEQDS
ncbi:hypothetical protein [Desulfatibacillum aliphaticivorans]|uniref:hypothetical protein n=1 Tax=Desulfatibacillum aliphaticivorans TaxID=218208 RepID=UPI000488C317|nr:hypothetical protein [Desulfatibacillum aliphaticivorans]